MNIRDSGKRCDEGITMPFIDRATLTALRSKKRSHTAPIAKIIIGAESDEQIQKETTRAYIQRKQKRCGR